ncbi:hypothetical protein [Alysiella filiformis]|uniref:Membrane domain of glycerophosphoryl diester phosphodiesterase n=1 Tax=Alysiella filiformis DSM 16848 TaxID=1120981 RepID=A0A286ENA3_9NEIS|nr:hypothetical protein [Alysiella filiformis]QMT31992.1 hypothetical protein H3L97_03710 [Alysiella filiformis]UBQ57100.1 hypothetical protein JF568_04965 [Alysiella filiformis DSM 16848]SOD72366.1 hypothetical protein SAMN02746062_02203 [Alysiella filiformis DSM 16848]
MDNTIQLLNKSQRQSLGDGLNWLNQSWHLLKTRFGKWLLVGTIFLLLNIAVSWILGFLAQLSGVSWIFDLIDSVFDTFMVAGLILAIASHAENGDFEIADMFSGFQLPVQKMIVVALIMHLPILLANLFAIEQLPLSIKWLLHLLSYVMWFMLPLVALHGLEPLSALKMSISGSLKNILPALGFVILMSFVFGGFMLGLVFILMLLLGTNGITMNSINPLATEQSATASLLMILIFYFPFLLMMLFVLMSVYFSYRNIWTNSPLK